jgi:hypothetical protein
VQKYITENGTDPVTGEKLEESDLVSVKASTYVVLLVMRSCSSFFEGPGAAVPRPPTHSSIPALLTALQNEWDALVLETFTLKQQYNSTRQELSYALYSQDAASRVIARLMRERDAAREYVFFYAHDVFPSTNAYVGPLSMSKPPWEFPPHLATMSKCLTKRPMRAMPCPRRSSPR